MPPEWLGTANDIAGAVTGSPTPFVEQAAHAVSAAETNEQARQAREDAARTWDGDRATLGSEWNSLSGQFAGFDGRFDGAPIARDPFEDMSHRQIYDGVSVIEAGQVNRSADAWRRMTEHNTDAFDTFRRGIEATVTEGWQGTSADAALRGTTDYVTAAARLPVATQLIAHGLDIAQGYLEQAKSSVPPPQSLTSTDRLVGKIPGSGMLHLAQSQADEAEQQARATMIEVYRPGAETVAAQTPLLPNSVDPTGGVPGAPIPGAGTGGSTTSGTGGSTTSGSAGGGTGASGFGGGSPVDAGSGSRNSDGTYSQPVGLGSPGGVDETSRSGSAGPGDPPDGPVGGAPDATGDRAEDAGSGADPTQGDGVPTPAATTDPAAYPATDPSRVSPAGSILEDPVGRGGNSAGGGSGGSPGAQQVNPISGGSIPGGSAPAGSISAGSIPGGSGGSTPGGSALSSTTPRGAVPRGSTASPHTPLSGRGLAGTAGAAESPMSRPGAGTPGRAGAPGFGGMVPPLGRGRGDDDDEHRSPDYLHNVDNGNELVGRLPRVAPPVLGAAEER